MRILAISNASAQESEVFLAVADILEKRGHQIMVFRQDLCLQGESIAIEVVCNIPKYLVVIDGKKYDLDTFDAFWYMHPMLPRELILYKYTEYRHFIDSQFFALRKGLLQLFREKRWINDPWHMFMAENKPYQIRLACQTGFQMPDTLITSDPEMVRDFYKTHHGNVVVKNLATSPIADHIIATNMVTDQAMGNIESVRLAPSIFQERIKKAYELRITVVGKKIFASKIYSQEDEATALDWRVKPKINDFVVKMERTILPLVIEDQIHVFMHLAGLQFGCIDMIVTPDGQYIFLEINPNGQWFFVQLKTGAKMGLSPN